MSYVSSDKFTSFDEPRSELVNKEGQENVVNTTSDPRVDALLEILELANEARTSEDFFGCCCRVMKNIEGLDECDTELIFKRINFPVKLISKVFTNENFKRELLRISVEEGHDIDKDLRPENLTAKTFLNSGISLAFLSLALVMISFDDMFVLYIRKHLTGLIKMQVRESGYVIDFVRICFSLEALIGINRYQYSKNPSAKFCLPINGRILFENLKIAKSLAGVSFLLLTINSTLSSHLKSAAKGVEIPQFNLSNILNNIYGVINRVKKGLEAYMMSAPERSKESVRIFFDSFRKNNEKNQLFIIEKICSGFRFQPNKKFHNVVLEKIQSAAQLKQDMNDFSRTNLKVFYGDIEEGDIEWSNKLYVISVKTLSLLAELSSAHDDRWKVSVAVFEYKEWLKAAHSILNKHSIEDEWALINEHVKQESSEVEWKSSFFTPVEKDNINDEALAKLTKDLFAKVVKTILGMLNTSGGTIIVGLVERPEAICRKDILDHLIIKNGRTFFDVGHELRSRRLSLDGVCLKIYQELEAITDTTAEGFNNLVSFEEVYLTDQDKGVVVVMVCVKKSDKYFFSIVKEGPKVMASLVMRADRQTIDVDIRKYVCRQSILQ